MSSWYTKVGMLIQGAAVFLGSSGGGEIPGSSSATASPFFLLQLLIVTMINIIIMMNTDICNVQVPTYVSHPSLCKGLLVCIRYQCVAKDICFHLIGSL